MNDVSEREFESVNENVNNFTCSVFVLTAYCIHKIAKMIFNDKIAVIRNNNITTF